MSAARKLTAEALSLQEEERAELARDLLGTLGPPILLSEEDELADVERRVERVLDEGSRGAPWSEVHARIQQALKSPR